MENVTDADIQHYEGLVRSTAARYVHRTEEEYEDLCQLLRVKAWKALLSFEPSKSSKGVDAQDKYVFSCLMNQCKDFLKKKKHHILFIEDIASTRSTDSGDDRSARDVFDAHYLQLSPEDAYKDVEDELPELPSTLTERESKIVNLLYLSFDYGEISKLLLVSRKEVGTTVKSIREKMADWRPVPAVPEPAPVVAHIGPATPLPIAQPVPSLSQAA